MTVILVAELIHDDIESSGTVYVGPDVTRTRRSLSAPSRRERVLRVAEIMWRECRETLCLGGVVPRDTQATVHCDRCCGDCPSSSGRYWTTAATTRSAEYPRCRNHSVNTP